MVATDLPSHVLSIPIAEPPAEVLRSAGNLLAGLGFAISVDAGRGVLTATSPGRSGSKNPPLLGVGTLRIAVADSRVTANYDLRGLRLLDGFLVVVGVLVPLATYSFLPGHPTSTLWGVVALGVIPWLHFQTHAAVRSFLQNVEQLAGLASRT